MAGRLDNLQAQRLAAGLSQDELARQANVALRTIIEAEVGGEVSDREAGQICSALGITRVTAGYSDLGEA